MVCHKYLTSWWFRLLAISVLRCTMKTRSRCRQNSELFEELSFGFLPPSSVLLPVVCCCIWFELMSHSTTSFPKYWLEKAKDNTVYSLLERTYIRTKVCQCIFSQKIYTAENHWRNVEWSLCMTTKRGHDIRITYYLILTSWRGCVSCMMYMCARKTRKLRLDFLTNFPWLPFNSGCCFLLHHVPSWLGKKSSFDWAELRLILHGENVTMRAR